MSLMSVVLKFDLCLLLLLFCACPIVFGNHPDQGGNGPWFNDLEHVCDGPVEGGEHNECRHFTNPDLPALQKDEGFGSSSSTTAARAGAIVVVKSGQCYTVYRNVCQGQILKTWNSQGISHVTYCGNQGFTCTTTTTPPPTSPSTTTSPPTDVINTPRPNPTCAPGSCGDPQFVGFHGQSYQFHGLADEIFNLVSTPTLQVNGHFVYLSAGKCDYNDTLCWTHPGTYVDQIGMMFQDHRVTFIAGTHDAGLHWKMNDETITKYGIYKFAQSDGADVILTYHHHNSVHISSELFNFRIVNSDMFFNIEAGLNDKHLLKIGAPRHTITDRILCEKEAHVDETKFQHASHSNETTGEHNHGAVEAMLQKKYGGIQVPIHGLIGQTWRNALVCGRHWIGAVSDYLCSDLFASDYFFNYFHE